MKPPSTCQLVPSGQDSANPFECAHTPCLTSIRPPPFGTTPSTYLTQTHTTAHLSTEPSHSWKTRDWMLTYSGIAFSRTMQPTFSGEFKHWKSNATLITTDYSRPPSTSPMPEDLAASPRRSSPMPPPPNDLLPIPQYPFLYPLVTPNHLAQDLAVGPALAVNHHRLYPSYAKNASCT